MGWIFKGWPLAAAVLVCWGFDSYWNGSALIGLADKHEGFAAWVQAVGVFAAVFLAGDLSRRHAARDLKRKAASRRRAAAMLLVVGVRRWYRAVNTVISDVYLWQQSTGDMGRAHGRLPEPELDRALDRAPELKLRDVKAILDAIAFRDSAQAGIAAAVEFDADQSKIASVVLEEGAKLSSLLDGIIKRLETEAGFSWSLESGSAVTAPES